MIKRILNRVFIVRSLPEDISFTGRALDVETFISSIPYRTELYPIYTIDPTVRYKKIFLEGKGDCSSLSFATAYYLKQHGVDY